MYQEIDTEIFILILLKIGKRKRKYRKRNDSMEGTEENKKKRKKTEYSKSPLTVKWISKNQNKLHGIKLQN